MDSIGCKTKRAGKALPTQSTKLNVNYSPQKLTGNYRNYSAATGPDLIMACPDLVIGYHRLDTKFFTGHSDASQGRRRLKVVEKWYRDRELGRGGFGTVFLERSGKGECRAVKVIAKDRKYEKDRL